MANNKTENSHFSSFNTYGNLVRAFMQIETKGDIRREDIFIIDEFENQLDYNITKLMEDLDDDTFNPASPYTFDLIDKKGKERHIVISTLRSRITQRALNNYLNGIFDKIFSNSSFAYRPGYSVQNAVRLIYENYKKNNYYIIRADIADFFESIEIQLLKHKLLFQVNDIKLWNLIEKILIVDKKNSTKFPDINIGVPQGLILSPLLSNIYLNDFDRKMDSLQFIYARYSDDIIVLVPTAFNPERVLKNITNYLKVEHLVLKEDKCQVFNDGDKFKYLGVWISKYDVFKDGKPFELSISEKVEKNEVTVESNPYKDVSENIYREGKKTIYLSKPGYYVRAHNNNIVVSKNREDIMTIPVNKIDQVILLEFCQITTQAIYVLLKNKISLTYILGFGRIFARVYSTEMDNPIILKLQFDRLSNKEAGLKTAKNIINGKIENMLVFITRRKKTVNNDEIDNVIFELKRILKNLIPAKNMEEVRGLEGYASKLYFSLFKYIISPPFYFHKRVKRPPTDPVNSLLSFGYTLLMYYIYSCVVSNGLNPYIGVIHTLRRNHPTLVSDLIEEFRSLIVDTVVVNIINTKSVKPDNFNFKTTKNGKNICIMEKFAREKFINLFEKRMSTKVGKSSNINSEGLEYRTIINTQVLKYLYYIKGISAEYKPYLW